MRRSKHNLSHYRLTSLNQGQLYPVMCEEVLPGDTFRHFSSVLMRVAPLVTPVMHPVFISLHHWFVPSRLCWDNWEPFITGTDPNLNLPTMTIIPSDVGVKLLGQALGIGSEVSSNIVVQTLPFRAYNRIYNEFYRDQDLQAKLPERTGDSGDLAADYAVQKVNWEKDYFTTCRPYPQQGANDEVALLNLPTAPVLGIGKSSQTFPQTGIGVFESDGTASTYARAAEIDPSVVDERAYLEARDASNPTYPNVRASLGGVGVSIEELRRALAMKKIREHRSRYGSRYRDMLAFLGVRSSDARLQRPEYLGGGKQTISFSEVLSTAETTEAVVGDMAGHGIAAMRTRPYRRFFEEHGYVISVIFVRPKTVYMNRVPRTFLRRGYEDIWQKELEMLGEQAVTNFEVFGDSGTPSGTFGYIPRYDEYRHGESSVSGEFRNLLDSWHMARDFTSQPALNATFVTADPTDRIYASSETDELYVQIAHKLIARRLVAKNARR